MNYSKHVVNKNVTPQMQPTPGKTEVVNAAGGYVFGVDAKTQLDRFLILGTEGGTYYVGEQKLTRQNASAIEKLIAVDGLYVVSRVVEISDSGRAPKNDAALFVLAMAAKLGNDETRKDALVALPKVARIGTHLFHFAQFVESFGGWGRGLRTAVANWYNDKPVDKLVMQAIKYQQRDGWSHRDLLRLSHPQAPSKAYNELYKYIVKGELGEEMSDPLRVVEAFEQLKGTTSEAHVIETIKNFDLPRECIPTEFLNSAKVWETLLEKMGLEAMIRNVATMTRCGLLAANSEATRFVVSKLNDADALHKARIHPIKVLAALTTYQSGHGARGTNTWSPVRQIVDALDSAFYKSFKSVEPTGKRFMLALDVSGSMEWSDIAGIPGLTPRIASAAMSLVTAATEQDYVISAFTSGTYNARSDSKSVDGITTLDLSPRQRLDDVVRKVSSLPAGGTDCSLPMRWAAAKKVPVDTFVIYTDNDTWAGPIKPFQALKQYRDKMGIPAKLVVVGMQSTDYSIADPSDAGMLDVVGFDTATPSIISDFSK